MLKIVKLLLIVSLVSVCMSCAFGRNFKATFDAEDVNYKGVEGAGKVIVESTIFISLFSKEIIITEKTLPIPIRSKEE